MRKLRVSFSLLLMLALVGIFGLMASAETYTNPEGSDELMSGIVNGLPETTNDNGLTNANQTGDGINTNDGTTADQVIKSKDMMKNDKTTATHRTHGEYQNNTNSCASCHQTHTAAAKALLFKDGVYNTCTACHDGTLGFYNVFKSSTAGTFGNTASHDSSVHMANDSVTVSAAPGGNRVGTDEKSWGKEFNCASCHAPHGSYSDRLLHYNPNNMAATSSLEGGNAAWSKVYDLASLPAADETTKDTIGKFILVRGTLIDFGITPDATAGETDATPAIVTYKLKLDHGVYSWEKAIAPIVYAYEYAKPNKAYESRLFKLTDPDTDADANGVPDEVDAITFPYPDGPIDDMIFDGNDPKATINLNLTKGYITGTGVAEVNYGQIARAYVVKMDLKPYDGADPAQFAANGELSYVDSENIVADFGGLKPKYSLDKTLYGYSAAGKGIAMSQYCASCHVDYLANSGSETGEFSSAYRHTTESDSYTCVRCHFAHGTEREIMKDANGNTIKDLEAQGWTNADAHAWMDDKNASSALKKFTNMSGCWACHNSSHAESLINNDQDDLGLTARPGGWKE